MVARSNFATLVGNSSRNVIHLGTVMFSTHFNSAYPLIPVLSTGSFTGTAAIAATSTSIVCTAMVVDAANTKPDGVSLSGIRFNPVPGSQE